MIGKNKICINKEGQKRLSSVYTVNVKVFIKKKKKYIILHRGGSKLQLRKKGYVNNINRYLKNIK